MLNPFIRLRSFTTSGVFKPVDAEAGRCFQSGTGAPLVLKPHVQNGNQKFREKQFSAIAVWAKMFLYPRLLCLPLAPLMEAFTEN